MYVATLQQLHGWSAAAVSAPVTVYYLAGALLTASIGDLYDRFGPRAVVAGGSIAMAAGVAALGVCHAAVAALPDLPRHVGWLGIDERRGDQHYPRPLVPATPAASSSASRSTAPRWAGSSSRPRSSRSSARLASRARSAPPQLVFLAVLLPVAAGVMRRGPEELGLGPDGDPRPSTLAARQRAPSLVGVAPRSARGGSGARPPPSRSASRHRSACSRIWSRS